MRKYKSFNSNGTSNQQQIHSALRLQACMAGKSINPKINDIFCDLSSA